MAPKSAQILFTMDNGVAPSCPPGDDPGPIPEQEQIGKGV
jgi:hypothetical protein